jgi:hypothetical protein
MVEEPLQSGALGIAAGFPLGAKGAVRGKCERDRLTRAADLS